MLLAQLMLLLLALLAFQKKAIGQNQNYRISGSVSDSVSGKYLDFITINLMTDSNTVIKADYTKTDGSFLFSGLKPLPYEVVIVGVGYKKKVVKADLSKSTELALGNIQMTSETVGLKEVTVSGTKQVIKQEIDRISYDLQADPESKVFSVLDMMRKVPYLSLDADNNIYLKGNADFKILINGKPSSMVERSYKDILRSMPASSIERIEVITTPPAKYDAEGLAGIINIITSKKVDNGINGSVNINERFPFGGPGVGGSVSARLGKWGMTAMAGGSVYNIPETYNTVTRITNSSTPTNLWQNSYNISKSRSGYIGYEVSYEVDTLNLISGQINFNGSKSSGTNAQWSVLNGSGEILQQYGLDNRNSGNGTGMDAALNYQKGFKADKNRLLTFSYRFFRFDNNQDADLAISERINYPLPDYRQLNDQSFSEQTIQVDYVYPYKKLNIEAGLKAIIRDNKSYFQYRQFTENSSDFEVVPGLSNKFANMQNVYGVYNTYQYNVKSWGFKAGARLEQTTMNADFISTESTMKQNYLNVIPSVSISKKFKKHNSGMNLGYSQRIQRPGIYQLNPFVDRSNPNFERTGNPNLRPALVHDFQIGYNRAAKGSLNFSGGGIFFTDLIFPVSVYDPVTNINRISFDNTGTARLFMANLSWNYPFTKRWNMNVNARAAHGKVHGTVNMQPVTNQGIMVQTNVSSGYRFEKNWRINANLNYTGPSINLQGSSNSYLFSSLSVSKDVVKDKLSLSASVNNPFTKFRQNYRYTSGPDFEQTDYRREYFRSFNVSANYKFGKLKDAIKKNKRGIRNDDVQN